MFRLSAGLVAGVLALGNASAFAQTGPVGPVGPVAPVNQFGPVNPVAPQQNQNLPMNEQSMAQVLQAAGYTYQQKQATNGTPLFAFDVVDGQRYAIESHLIKANNGGYSGYYLIAVFGQANSVQAMDLLKANFDNAPCFFALRGQQLVMILENPFNNINVNSFKSSLSYLLTSVKKTQNLWGSAASNHPVNVNVPTGPTGPGGPIAPVNNLAPVAPVNMLGPIGPVGPTAPVIAPVAQGIANTTWKGQETLAGYGALTFQFGAGNQVTMIDAQGSHPGSYTLQGQAVVIDFGGTIYQGTINGNTMSGTAASQGQNGLTTWNWTVTK